MVICNIISLKKGIVFSASPSMRGSTPLDVAAASVMDNYELALALTEPDLEKVRTSGSTPELPGTKCIVE